MAAVRVPALPAPAFAAREHSTTQLSGARRPLPPRPRRGTPRTSEEERRAILTSALNLGAEYVDVEWRAIEGFTTGVAFRDLVKQSPERIVVSSHDFDGVPADLEWRARAMRATGAGTIKIAVLVSRVSQTLGLKAIAKDGPAVAPVRDDRPPRLGETLTRVLLLGSENTTEAARRHADLLIKPRAEGVGLLEFHQLDTAREAGRVAAREALEQAPASWFA